MNKVPFKRFVTTFLLFSKDVSYISEKLFSFGYAINDEDISKIFSELKNSLPEKYRELLNTRQIFDLNDSGQVEWLKQFGVFEYYDFIIRQKENLKDPPEYFRWCNDCLWAHGYQDVMSLINILMFNGESMDEISSIIMFKYRKKISIAALELYKKIFWDTENITAKEALFYCVPFRDDALIVRHIRGGTEIEKLDKETEKSDGSDVPFVFHDTAYIKWKIGYREISVPTSRDFLEKVKTDSYFKYYEAMNMVNSIEIEEEEGTNEKLGEFDSKKIKKRNVEEQKVKLVKGWLDMYLKANSSIPEGGGQKTEEFFEKMKQLTLDFGEPEDEKIASVEDMKGMINDIKGDMSNDTAGAVCD